jgi:hypothetical protein
MEHQFRIRQFVILIALMLFFSCGYMENDNIVSSIEVVSKFKLQQKGNSDEISLVYQDSEKSSIIIIQNCDEVIFDSVKSMIYVQSMLNKYNIEYSSIEILSPSRNPSKPYFLQSISKDLYDKKAVVAKTIYSK